MHVLTPEEIAEVVYGDNSPLQSLSLDEAKKRIAELIQRLVDNELEKQKNDYEKYYNKSNEGKAFSIHGG